MLDCSVMEQEPRDSTGDDSPTLSALVAGRVRDFRHRAGLSARQLADLCAEAGSTSLTRSTLAKIESGVRVSLTIDEVGTLAEVFNISVADLVAQQPLGNTYRPPSPDRFQDRFHRVEAGATLVARAAQRHRVASLLTEAQGDQPAVVVIEGDPGVGKTHLMEWLASRARHQRALVVQGSCFELSGMLASPYGALSEGLRVFERLHGEANRDVLASRPWNTLTSLTSSGSDPVPTSHSQQRIFGSVLQMADAIGRGHSMLLLIFEDLQWADSSTLDLVRYVAKAKSNERLLLVCTHRPVPQRHPLRIMLSDLDFQRRVEYMTLPPFSLAELDEFVTSRTGRQLPEKRLRRYYELTDGNPYYASQLVATDSLGSHEVEVPPSLRELMLTRLNRLSDAGRMVVRIAAVAGRHTDDNLLTAVSDLSESLLDSAIAECIDQQILVRDPNDRYAFKHSLLRETAYNEIRRTIRTSIHARVAEAMTEARASQTQLTPALAYHWFEAGRLPEALIAAFRAATMTVRLNAFREATAQYHRVLGLWGDVPAAAELTGTSLDHVLRLASDAARSSGDIAQALQWVRRAISIVDYDVAPVLAAALQERLGSYLWEAGQQADAAEAYLAADGLLEGQDASALASRVQSGLAAVAIRQGRYAEGANHARRAAELARSGSVIASAEEGRALSSLGLALIFTGRIDEARHALHAAIGIAKESDQFEDLFRAYAALGVCLEQGGRLEEAVTAMTEGLEYAKEHNLLNTPQTDALADNAAAALLLLGRYAEGASYLDSMLRRRSVAESMYALLTRAEIHVAQGQFADAERILAEIRREPNVDPRFIGPLYGCLADAAAWSGDLDRAAAVAEEGMQALRDTANPRVVVQLAAVGLRIAADRRDVGLAAALLEWAAPAGTEPQGTEIGWLIRQTQAEHDRTTHSDSPEAWAAIANGWATLGQPFRAAYARLREADVALRSGDRGRAVSAARQAGDEAQRIQAAPLFDAAREFLDRLPANSSYGLTRAQLTILAELATGATYSAIASRLHVSPNTVGVHVQNILRKMGVSSRHEAVATALRDGVL
ncbi:helix-turn-helix transcriptional regulator [Hamadaea tsunoensis]|uniref:helix-turn-helix transcriptional regulator n=1 Tax=Hamadaea tsunoensis TaxID=53368 RepID=UPI000417DADB|nr:AAA family ATPase [Hamadaea tsunoensis]